MLINKTENAYFNIVASLANAQALSIITGKLVLFTSADKKTLDTCLTLIAHIILYPPVMSSNRKSIHVKHGQGKVWIAVVLHPPKFVIW